MDGTFSIVDEVIDGAAVCEIELTQLDGRIAGFTRRSVATSSAASGRRTAMTTLAPAPASAEVVSMPIPLAPPVTIIVFPGRSTPLRTSEAVEWNPNGNWSMVASCLVRDLISRPTVTL
ncbi:hypothetical protein X760_33070 [Mesorhizobium sp. LSHC422A00]|nr:hypothetical protein X760_33070 [Mesorhizobium sp. LSHC422A00]